MKTLSIILNSLSAEEKQEFIIAQKKKNRRTDTKNAKLFKLINTGVTENLDIKLYGKPAKNSFHALCKRLQDNLIDFIASKSFATESSEELSILKLLLASRIFFEKKLYPLAIKTLEKAEKEALPLDIYALLNEIYHTKVQFAHLNPKWVLEDLLTTSKQNMKNYQQEFQLNQAYAIIKSQLNNKSDSSIKEVIISAFSKFELEINESLTYKSLFQLMEITIEKARLDSNFYSINPFLNELYEILNKKEHLKNKHTYYYLSILHLLCISHFRNKNFALSIKLGERMEIEMNNNQNASQRQFIDKLTIIKALNYNYTGDATKAITILEHHKNDSLEVKLLLAMCHFQQNNFKIAYKYILKLNHSDTWYEKKMNWIWVLKKKLLEILILTELDKLDLVLIRLQQFKRKYTKQLQDNNEDRVLTFINLINKYYENPSRVTTTAFKDEVENSFKWIGTDKEDIFVISFYAWLKAKMHSLNIYQVTLELTKK